MFPDEQRSVSYIIITKSILIHTPMEKKKKYLFIELYTVNWRIFTGTQAFLTKINVDDFQDVSSTMMTQRYYFLITSGFRQ